MAMHRALSNVLKEIGEQAHSVEKRWPSTTRGDLIRRIRAAVELVGARPAEDAPGYDPRRDPDAEEYEG